MEELEPQLARFHDLPIELHVEVDRKFLKVREILSLQAGVVLQLDRSAGDNMSLYFQGVLVGSGEIVVIEDTIGIRITDLGAP